MVTQELTLDEKINQAFDAATGWFVDSIFAEIPITEEVGIPWVLIVLIVGAGFFTLYFKFVNFRHFLTAIKVVKGDYDEFEVNISDAEMKTTLKIFLKILKNRCL